MKRKTRKRTLKASFRDRIFNSDNAATSYDRSKWKRLFLFGIASMCFIFFVYVLALSRQLISLEELETYEPELTTKIYSADGKVIKELYTKKRVQVPLDNMPDCVWQSVIASEDHRFFRHWGFVPQRLLKSFYVNLTSLRIAQGGSTITQQLARQQYYSLAKIISRKIKEIMTAIQIERTYTKHEILEMYINQIYTGPGIYGIPAAARYYLDKDIEQITLPEAALLTQLLPNAGIYSPFTYPDRALRRRDVVLYRMMEVGYISREEYEEAKTAPLEVADRSTRKTVNLAPYFSEYIRQQVQDVYGWEAVYEGGLNIYTTLDSRVQACADSAIKIQLPIIEERQRNWILNNPEDQFAPLVDSTLIAEVGLRTLMRDSAFVDSVLDARTKVQVCLIAMDPSSGHILALVGGRDFNESEFNRAIQATRQPGSVFKPFAYLAAIDNGYLTTHQLLDVPAPKNMVDGSIWNPPNYDGSMGGKTTLREGLYRSKNQVTARLVLEEVPPQQVVDYAQRLGITTPLQPVYSIALGSSDVIPREIVSAFGVFANKGILQEPMSILMIEDKDGTELERRHSKSREVLREESAYIMVDMLKSVLDEGKGTGHIARTVYGFMRPAGGKTGTTNDWTDAWFVGFTPQIVAGVWVGIDDPSITLGDGQSGAVAALPIWARFMEAAHDSLALPVKDFVQPDGVVRLEICNDTKLLATESCPDIVEEVFLQDFRPTEYCDKHRGNNRSARKRRIY